MSTFECAAAAEEYGYVTVPFSLGADAASHETPLTRWVDPHPFVPSDAARREERCEDVFAIQAHGLAKRLSHTHSTRAVIGLSGGLDSTLALLVTVRAFDLLGLPRDGVIAVTMPGFGTTDRTYNNACELARTVGAELREIGIAASVAPALLRHRSRRVRPRRNLRELSGPRAHADPHGRGQPGGRPRHRHR